jgi:hypothetical protein
MVTSTTGRPPAKSDPRYRYGISYRNARAWWVPGPLLVGMVSVLALVLFAGREALGAGPEVVSIASDGTRENDVSTSPSVSANGRYVVFQSRASSLVAEDINGRTDVFVHDLVARTTERIRHRRHGRTDRQRKQCGAGDQRRRALSGVLVRSRQHRARRREQRGGTGDIYVRDRTAGTTARASVSST